MRRLSAWLRPTAPLLLALALWGVLFRPLALDLGFGIPFTAHHAGPQRVETLVPGDHLQLLYHFWLTRDMLAGGTPWFHNLYEFNTGDDAARKGFDPGYVPFSWAYAAVSPWAGHAVGWNVAQLLAILLAAAFLFRLAWRHANDRLAALCAATLGLVLPYQWITLAGGSPTGFGMAWVPAIALGLDIAIRDGRLRGGLLAGLALVFCYTSDLHSFFFGALLVPAWCGVAWCGSSRRGWLPDRAEARGLFRTLAPVAVAGVLAGTVGRWLQGQYAGTDVEGGRRLGEVMANSPERLAILGKVVRAADFHFRIGIVLLVAVAWVAVWLAWRWASARRRQDGTADPGSHRKMAVALLLLAGMAGILLLGLGTNGFPRGWPLRIVRRLLPPYRMIRQPVKILCVLPTVLVPFLALGFGELRQWAAGPHRVRRALALLVPTVLALLGSVELAGVLRIGITRLPGPNGAYQAVVAHAAERGEDPHAMVLPVWPGDSAWSSLCEYRAMQGRIRMVNGYAAVRTGDYVNQVFRRFESLTQGRVTDEQVEALLGMGVNAVVLHEDFPDVVSPFPAGATVRRLLAHPRLELLSHAEGIWSFALLGEPKPAASSGTTEDLWLPPARRWHWPSGGAPGGSPQAPVWSMALRSPLAQWPDLRWLVRVEGDGLLRIRRGFKEDGAATESTATADEVSMEGGLFFARHGSGPAAPTATLGGRSAKPGTARWIELPFGNLPREGWATPWLEIVPAQGTPRVTDVLLSGGPLLWGRDRIRLPAADLFRCGVRSESGNVASGVRFRPGYDPASDVLHGPHLPLSPGTWHVWLECADATQGSYGTLRVFLGNEEAAAGDARCGMEPLVFRALNVEPLDVRLAYSGSVGATISAVVLERIGD